MYASSWCHITGENHQHECDFCILKCHHLVFVCNGKTRWHWGDVYLEATSRSLPWDETQIHLHSWDQWFLVLSHSKMEAIMHIKHGRLAEDFWIRIYASSKSTRSRFIVMPRIPSRDEGSCLTACKWKIVFRAWSCSSTTEMGGKALVSIEDPSARKVERAEWIAGASDTGADTLELIQNCLQGGPESGNLSWLTMYGGRWLLWLGSAVECCSGWERGTKLSWEAAGKSEGLTEVIECTPLVLSIGTLETETCNERVSLPSCCGFLWVALDALDTGSCLDGLRVGRKWGSIWTCVQVGWYSGSQLLSK